MYHIFVYIFSQFYYLGYKQLQFKVKQKKYSAAEILSCDYSVLQCKIIFFLLVTQITQINESVKFPTYDLIRIYYVQQIKVNLYVHTDKRTNFHKRSLRADTNLCTAFQNGILFDKYYLTFSPNKFDLKNVSDCAVHIILIVCPVSFLYNI